MYSPEVKQIIIAELDKAQAARANGNEGQARVLARRAAGKAIQSFLQYHKQPIRSTSAVDLLEWVRSQPGFPESIQLVAEHLLLRVTPDFVLPIDVDLLSETLWFVDTLEVTAFPQPE